MQAIFIASLFFHWSNLYKEKQNGYCGTSENKTSSTLFCFDFIEDKRLTQRKQRLIINTFSY
jgi:hypothetical protein